MKIKIITTCVLSALMLSPLALAQTKQDKSPSAQVDKHSSHLMSDDNKKQTNMDHNKTEHSKMEIEEDTSDKNMSVERPDFWLTTKVKSKFASSDLVSAMDISVETNDHEVTLSGYANTTTEKEEAVKLAKSTEGVTSVVDKIKLKKK